MRFFFLLLLLAAACDLPPETPTRPPTATFRLVPPSPTVAPLLPTLPDLEDVGGPESTAALGFTPAAPPVVGGATVTPRPVATAPAIPMGFPLPDGSSLDGLFASADRPNAPAALLLHDSGGGKEDWRAVMNTLRNGGITVLAIDLPTSGAVTALQTVFGRLRSLPGVNPGAVRIVGVGAGANLALVACGAVAECVGAALISPRSALRGLPITDGLPAYGTRPILLIASTPDTESARVVTELQTALRGPKTVILAEEPESGFNLLDLRPDIVNGLASFLRGGV